MYKLMNEQQSQQSYPQQIQKHITKTKYIKSISKAIYLVNYRDGYWIYK